MTVAELIRKLSGLHQDAIVLVPCCTDAYCAHPSLNAETIDEYYVVIDCDDRIDIDLDT